MSADILNLPWQIQVALASGYAAYLLAYVGIRDHHKPIDTAFIGLIFSLVASGMLKLMDPYSDLIAGAAAFTATLLCGLLWRIALRDLSHAALKAVDFTWSDDMPSAWATLNANSRHGVSQISVLLDDGTWLRCDDTTLFNEAAFGPCQLGPNGDVALYLTHKQFPDGTVKPMGSVLNGDHGDRITYVPAARVRQVNIRHIRPS